MAFSDVCEVLNARFRTQVADLNGIAAAGILRDNAPEPQTVAGAKWARIRISTTRSERVASGGTGANRTRTFGNATFELTVVGKQGAGVVNGLVDATVAAFRDHGNALQQLRCLQPTAGEAQQQGDAWCRRIVTVPFRFDEVA